MPQLPSGKHIALDPSPLQKVISEAYGGIKVHELMEVESVDKLFAHIGVLYFRPAKEKEKENLPLADFSIVPPYGLEAYHSGFNLVSIRDEVGSWEHEDQKAFVAFLNEDRTNKFFENILDSVKSFQSELAEHPGTLQGMLALWWKLGIHPLQEDEND